jgi:hypothetical protein
MADQADWKFTQRMEGSRLTWTWRRSSADGSNAVSRDFPNYAVAVIDAIQSGFRPREQPYLVESIACTVRFIPGRRPVTVYPAAAVEAPGNTKDRRGAA